MQATGNGLLTMMTEPVFQVLRTRYAKPSPATHEGFWAMVDQEHEEITECIAARTEGAREAMRIHLVNIRNAYSEA